MCHILGRMAVTVRPLRDDEMRLYLQIHERAIRGLAATHYSQDDITEVALPNHHPMAVVRMGKDLQRLPHAGRRR